jgi:glycosyltransferase involved in cell wall biosynthesis
MLMLDQVAELEREFDILHFHTDYLHFPMVRLLSRPTVTTLHGRQDLPDLAPIYRRCDDIPLVSISNAQRAPVSWANWIATVHHGLPADLLTAGPGDGDYLAFIGRISPEKRLDRAIEIARSVGIPLKVAAKLDAADKAYFERVISPLLDGPGVEFVGEIGDREKPDFLGRAKALLFPIDWPEPFGLVMIEAMACGTPVLAFNCGSVPEVVDNGISGVVVSSMEEALAALPKVLELDRNKVRQRFEQRFTVEVMAQAYLEVYERLVTPSLAPTDEALAPAHGMGGPNVIPLFPDQVAASPV